MIEVGVFNRVHQALSSYRQHYHAEPRQMRISEATMRRAIEEAGDLFPAPEAEPTMFGVPVKIDDTVGDEIVLVASYLDTPINHE